MSKHTWLTKPTQGKADRLLAAYRLALKHGIHPVNARLFAGFAIEDETQNGKRSYYQILQGVKRSDWRFARGANSDNYILCFSRHVPLMLAPLYTAMGLVPDAPTWVLADKLEESGQTEEAEEVRAMVA